MQIQPVDTKSVTDKLLLSTLKVSEWSGRTTDKAATRHVLLAENAVKGSGRFDKTLLPGCKLLKAIHKQTSVIRQLYYENTLAWTLGDKRLLASVNYIPFQQLLDAKRLEWRARVDAFLQDYDQLVQAARSSLGGLFEDADYPDVEDVDKKFGVQFDVEPLPAADFWVSSVDSELESMRDDLQERMQGALDNSMSELWERLYGKVKHMADKLGDEDAIFRDSLVKNLEDICDLMPALNFAGDKKLEALASEVRDQLAGLSPGDLRKDKSKRSKAAEAAKAIEDKMGAFMGTPQ